MLYLEQTTEPQIVKIPRNILPNPGGDYGLTIENTLDRSRITLTPTCVIPRALNYAVTVALPDVVPAGEYSYEFRQGLSVLAVGILTVGNYEHATTQYESATSYEQFVE